jgi:hypothetical protein
VTPYGMTEAPASSARAGLAAFSTHEARA